MNRIITTTVGRFIQGKKELNHAPADKL